MKPFFVASLLLSLFWAQSVAAETTSEETKACAENPSVACVLMLARSSAETVDAGEDRVIAFAAIANAYHSSNREKDAAVYWRLAYEAALSVESEEERDKALSGLVIWSDHRAEVQEVIEAAEQILNNETRSKALLSFSKHLADAGKFDQAFLVLARQMAFLQLAQGYAHLASAQAKAGDVEGAKRSFTGFSKASPYIVKKRYYATGFPETVPDADSILRDIAVAQVKAGYKKESAKTLADMEHGESVLYAKVEIAEAQAEIGDLQAARRTINGMRRTDKENSLQKHILQQQRDEAFARVALVLAQQDDLKRALATAKKIKQDDRYDYTIADIAQSYSAQGVEKVLYILRHRRGSEPPETVAPWALAFAHANSGDIKGARPYFAQIMSKDDNYPVPIDVAIRWGDIGTILHSHGDLEEAERVMEATLSYIRKREFRGSYPLLAAITVSRLSAQQHFSKAISTATTISDPTHRANALRHVLTELLKNQNL